MSSATTPALFQPIRIGDITLAHRVVLPPLTRLRNDAAHVPTDVMLEYYTQRASTPGTLLITEATYVSGQSSGLPHAPGIWNDAQIAAWKKVSLHVEPTIIGIRSSRAVHRSSRRCTRRDPTSTFRYGLWDVRRARHFCIRSSLTILTSLRRLFQWTITPTTFPASSPRMVHFSELSRLTATLTGVIQRSRITSAGSARPQRTPFTKPDSMASRCMVRMGT